MANTAPHLGFAELAGKVSVAPISIQNRCVVADWSHCMDMS